MEWVEEHEFHIIVDVFASVNSEDLLNYWFKEAHASHPEHHQSPINH